MKRRAKYAAGLAAPAAAAAAMMVLASAAMANDALLARGSQIVEDKCSRCHAVGRAGASPVAKAPPLRDLSRRYPVETLAESLAEGIMTGHEDMPVFRFERTDVEAIITYLRSISPG